MRNTQLQRESDRPLWINVQFDMTVARVRCLLLESYGNVPGLRRVRAGTIPDEDERSNVASAPISDRRRLYHQRPIANHVKPAGRIRAATVELFAAEADREGNVDGVGNAKAIHRRVVRAPLAVGRV